MTNKAKTSMAQQSLTIKATMTKAKRSTKYSLTIKDTLMARTNKDLTTQAIITKTVMTMTKRVQRLRYR